MNPSLVLTFASGLLLLLTGLTSGRPGLNEEARAPEESETTQRSDG